MSPFLWWNILFIQEFPLLISSWTSTEQRGLCWEAEDNFLHRHGFVKPANWKVLFTVTITQRLIFLDVAKVQSGLLDIDLYFVVICHVMLLHYNAAQFCWSLKVPAIVHTRESSFLFLQFQFPYRKFLKFIGFN